MQPKSEPGIGRLARGRARGRYSRLESLEARRLLTTFTVNTFADTLDVTPGDGVASDANGNTSLRAAVMEANALSGADTILLSAGTYRLTRYGVREDAARTGDLDITEPLTILGAGPDQTIIDAGSIFDRIFDVRQGPSVTSPLVVELAGLKLTGGEVKGETFNRGGAMRMEFYTNVTVRDTAFVDNQALGNSSSQPQLGLGGAISSRGALTIHATTFDNNYAFNYGGAVEQSGVVFSDPNAVRAEIHDSTFSTNRSMSGGAIHSVAPLYIDHSAFVGNVARNPNGGSGEGGAIDSGGGDFTRLTLVNSTVSGNVAIFGGGINTSEPLEIQFSTIVGNTSSRGGGLRLRTDAATIGNSIVAGNSATIASSGDDVDGAVTSLGYNLIGDGAFSTGFGAVGDLVGTTANPVDPLLGPLDLNGGTTPTHALLSGSPAIDTANPDSFPAVDQRHQARPIDGNQDGTAIPDIGAYEVPPPPIVLGIDLETNIQGDDADTPAGPLLVVGDRVSIQYTVTNTGNVSLANVVVRDDNGTPDDTSDDFVPAFVGGDTNNDQLLDLDESWTYLASRTVTPGQFAGVAVVSGDDATGTIATVTTDTDASHFYGQFETRTVLTDGVLYIIGTTNADQVLLPVLNRGILMVYASFLPGRHLRLFNSSEVNQIVVYLLDGNDHLTIGPTVHLPTLVFGGEGNDHLRAGGGPAVLSGGGGSDFLFGGAGRSILIGGLGTDVLVGGNDDDILIGGTTSHDDERILAAALNAWKSADPFEERVDEIASLLTVVDDESLDLLAGRGGHDLIFDGPESGAQWMPGLVRRRRD